MSLSVHALTVGQFVPMLKNLGKILEKAEAFAAAKKVEAGVIEGLRLAPDMLSFARQVQLASDFAKNSTARLAGIEAPKFEDNETTFAELQDRITRTLDWLATVPAASIDGREEAQITFPVGRDKTRTMTGEAYLKHWALPNLFFHVTTAYALLRHAGVDVGKTDYLAGAQAGA